MITGLLRYFQAISEKKINCAVSKKALLLGSFILAAIVAFGQNDDIAQAQHQLLNMEVETSEGKMNTDPRAAWFPKAGLGLFIHWGAIASYGSGDISWCMLANRSWVGDGTVTPNFYYSLMNSWKPQKMDFESIIKKAKEAGYQYAVFTTKHHDGYTMWPTKHGSLGTHTKMGSRDFVKEFVNACRKYGLKIGLYYSPPDWYFDRNYRNWSYSNKVFLDMDHKPLNTLKQIPADHDQKRKELVNSQVRELLTKYGKIDLMWFDGGAGEIPNEEVRKLQPGIVINRRNGGVGDYGDTEGIMPTKRFSGWFETCDPVWPNRFWSYSYSDAYATTYEIIANLVTLRAWGGNYLTNLAPMGDGSLPPLAKKGLHEMAQWMRYNKEAVIDVEAGNYPEKSAVPVTVKGNTIYAFAMPNYQDVLKISVKQRPVKAILLRTQQELDIKFENGMALVVIPPKDRVRLPDVVKLMF